ncbi:MAG: hypothetical protein ACOC2K_01615, partial [Bacteroidota bacterium]
TRITEKHKADAILDAYGVIYNADIVVESKDESGYTLSWTFTDVNIMSEAKGIMSLVGGLQIKYMTDHKGQLLGVLNHEEIVNNLRSALDKLAPQTESPVNLTETIQEMEQIINDPDRLQDDILKEIIMLHSVYAIEFPDSGSQVQQNQLPNFYGGEPLPASLELVTEKTDENYILRLNQSIEKQPALKVLEKTIQKLRQQGNEMPDMSEIQNLDISDSFMYIAGSENNFIKLAKYERTFILGMVKQINRSNLELE